jgi:hypothetical protein
MEKQNFPIIIDIEASGFGRNSYPIEIGIVLENRQTHCFLIKPAPEWRHWDSEVESLHGISRDTLLKHGHSTAEVGDFLNELLIGKTIYSDGWSYDQTWLHVLYESIEKTPLFRIDSLARLLNESQINRWDNMKNKLYKKYNMQRHRATNDAKLLQKTYAALINQ